jgi:hypothetical protein
MIQKVLQKDSATRAIKNIAAHYTENRERTENLSRRKLAASTAPLLNRSLRHSSCIRAKPVTFIIVPLKSASESPQQALVGWGLWISRQIQVEG